MSSPPSFLLPHTHTHSRTRTHTHTAKATFVAISRTYTYLTPDLWPEVKLGKPPFQEFTDYLAKTQKPQPMALPSE